MSLKSGMNFKHRQRGMVLLVSLVFLLLLTMLGISSMQNATLQEKMAGSVTMRNESFQTAEAVLRQGESAIMVAGYSLPKCTNTVTCLPPPESTNSALPTPGFNGSSGVTWVRIEGGLYAVQNLGTATNPIRRPPTCSASSTVTLYRVTAVAEKGATRTVLESIYANC
ncbi:PilX N-terminal domain-containing pilus assembly protein [Pseudomonas sp. D4-18]